MSELAPIGDRERIATVDVLRGLALCGVLVSNLYMLYSGRWLAGAEPATTIDHAARVAMQIFVEGKAQNLLTFLFGFGFAAQLLRANEHGEPVVGLYTRRMLALLLIGGLHTALIWWGDVTWGYAICGFAMLAFHRAPNAVRIGVGVVLAIVPFAIYVHFRGGKWAAGLFGLTPQHWESWSSELAAATASTDYLAIIWNHVRYALLWSAPIFVWYYPALIGRFLLGYVAGAQRWFERDGADRLPLFRRLLVGGLVVGVPCCVARMLRVEEVIAALADLPRWLTSALYMIELLAMAAAYIAIVVLLMQRPRWRRALMIVAPAGRMPLTAYVLQSVICTSLFYGWGLDWSTPGEAAGLVLGLAIFAIEVVLAHLWLTWFRIGPLEWLWRLLVYLRPQPMRRRGSSIVGG